MHGTLVTLLLACLLAAGDPPPRDAPAKRVLRVAADPNNLPFTSARLDGFENEIAALLADELGAELSYTWRAQRRGFFRETLKEGRADLVIGVPARFELAATTRPYYRSTYVFLSRKDRELGIASFDDPRLRGWRIGVQVVGEDGANTPPAEALARRGIVDNVVGYGLYGDYREDSPPARIVEAVARGEVDLALVWGPLAGACARRQPVELVLTPAKDERFPDLAMAFDVALGVRRGEDALREELDRALVRRRPEVERILDRFGIPRLPVPPPAARTEGDDGR